MGGLRHEAQEAPVCPRSRPWGGGGGTGGRRWRCCKHLLAPPPGPFPPTYHQGHGQVSPSATGLFLYLPCANTRKMCQSHRDARGGEARLGGCSSTLKSWAASRPSRTLHQSALFKHTGRRLSGLKQASAVLPLEPVGDQSTNQYESSFLEEAATPCCGLEVIVCCN